MASSATESKRTGFGYFYLGDTMNDIHIDDLTDMIIADSVDLPFLEFRGTVFNQYRTTLADERNLAWVLWMLSRKVNGNEKKIRQLMAKQIHNQHEDKKDQAVQVKENIDSIVAQRIKAMQANGEVMTKTVRDKYKRIIEMLCIGSVYDFEMAMRTEFPNFTGDSAHRKHGKDGDK